MDYYQGQQFAPQGFLGGALGGMLGGMGGEAIGNIFGQGGLGRTIGNTAGGLLGAIAPFSAGPQFAPQGAFGNFLGQIARPVGGAVGGAFGQSGLGEALGGIAGNFANLIPFSAGPQFAPQGVVGDFLGHYGGDIGRYAGQLANQYGESAGRYLGGLAQEYLPFSAGPQFAPQGLFGNILGQVARAGAGAIGQRFGQPGLGQMAGGIAGNLANLIPFSAGPQFAPQGFVGDFLGQHGGDIGRYAGQLANQYGESAGRYLGGLAQEYLPFNAGPQFAPQGMFGNILGQVARAGAGALGQRFGQPGLGQIAGGIAGNLAGMIPFSAMPVPQQAYY